MTLADDDPRHGTENGYTNLKCRCAACTEAHRVYFQDFLARHPEYRARKNQRQKEWYDEKRQDPEWRAQKKAYDGERYRRKKLGE